MKEEFSLFGNDYNMQHSPLKHNSNSNRASGDLRRALFLYVVHEILLVSSKLS